jgi:hypothetical protein
MFLGVVSIASAQSLLDNEFYKAGKDYLSQSQSALDAGDYDGANSFALKAKDSFAKSDEYVATMTLFYRANGWLYQANERIAYARSIKADANYRDAYDTAVAAAASAKDQMDAKNYPQSIELSKSVLDTLKDIAPVTVVAAAVKPVAVPQAEPPGPPDLPRYYTVQLTLPLRDCLWRIAGFPFVYNNPWKWRLLYEANKSILLDPSNPDLIEVGQRLEIPSLAGETRSGDYDPVLQYPQAPSSP